ncbi:PTS sugar transporter subunit IIA [Endothiovibrio diazotrophicus]
MSVGLLLITHNRLGDELLDTVRAMFLRMPLTAVTLAVARNDPPEQVQARAEALVSGLDEGDGVLLLTDMYGSTPSNIANRLAAGERRRVVYGINLPMLVRVLNYAALDLDALADKAYSGGREGVVEG